ncbi:hypothetical protein ACIGW3_31295 [Streptomyces sp. NPDC053499]|uniref:SbtR family transcriptional regulator n=1 Tax=Streptomyces sp. NPDC053499 TaxID=3365707 RepID=UPI0037CE055C
MSRPSRAVDRLLTDASGAAPRADARRIPSLEALRRAVRRLVTRAQEAGVVRLDTAWQDVAFLFAAAATGEHTLGLHAGERQWERSLRFILEGLRAPGPATPSP